MGLSCRSVVMLSMFLAAAPSCRNAKPEAQTTAKVGIITALTGHQANFGLAQQRGYTLALEEINAEGGVLGKQLEIDIFDEQSKADVAIQGVTKLIDQDHVPIVLGAYSSESTLAVLPLVAHRQVPFLVPTAVADDVIEQRRKGVYRLCGGVSDYARTMVEFWKAHGNPKTLALIHENTAYGGGVASAMRKAASAAGMSIVDEETYDATSLHYGPMLKIVKEKRPDAVYFGAYLKDAVALMKESRKVGLSPRYFTAAAAGFSAPEFPSEEKGAGKDAEYTISVSQWMPQAKWPGAKEFDDKFFAKFGTHAPYQAAAAYVGLKVAALAIKRANKLEPAAIGEALKAIRMDTAFGPVGFADSGQNEHPVLVTQVQKGQYQIVWPKDVATAEVMETPAWSARP